MADSKKTKELDFEKELVPYILQTGHLGNIIHRKHISTNIHRSLPYCFKNYKAILSLFYKKGTQYSDICKKCLKSHSMEEIRQLKHFLIVQKLKGK